MTLQLYSVPVTLCYFQGCHSTLQQLVNECDKIVPLKNL